MPRTLFLATAALFIGATFAGEEKPAAKQFDWSDPATLKAYWDWVSVKYSRPATIDKTAFDVTKDEQGLAAAAMMESAAPTLDDVKKGTLLAANIIGQMLAQGAPIYKVGIIVKSGEQTGVVMLPAGTLAKLGAESIKGEKADKAVLKKMTDLILAKADWSEVEKLVKGGAK